MLKMKNLRFLCAAIGFLGYFAGALSVKGFILAGKNSGNIFMAPFSFSVSDFSLKIESFSDLFCNSSLFLLLILLLGLSAVGFFTVFPVIYYKMYSLGFTASVFYWLYGGKGILYILLTVPCVVSVFVLLAFCGGHAVRFSFKVLDGLSLFKDEAFAAGEVTFKNYFLCGTGAVLVSFLLPVYESFALPWLFGLIG